MSLLDSYNERIYTSIDSIDNCDDNGLMTEAILPGYLNPLDPQGLAPHKLHLRLMLLLCSLEILVYMRVYVMGHV